MDYRVSYKQQSSSVWLVFSEKTNIKPHTVTELTPGIVYEFRVEARNLVGHSPYSASISELAAQIPDAPIALADVPSITLADRIGLTWQPPLFNGGSPIIDYRLWFDDATEATFEILANNLQLSYTALNLVQGKKYTFKVEAYNIYGYSAYSVPVSILAAQIPAIPAAPVTIWRPDDVIVDWTAPDDGGSPIVSYRILIRQADGATYSTALINCDGT